MGKISDLRKRRTPKWSESSDIKEFYKNCPDGHHVDHIVPLKGNRVSGLHVISNLQYLPASLNMAKGNRYYVNGMPRRDMVKEIERLLKGNSGMNLRQFARATGWIADGVCRTPRECLERYCVLNPSMRADEAVAQMRQCLE